MSYREKLDIGMSEKEVLEILGEPDDIKEESISSEWKWESIIDDDKAYEAVIDFTRGKVCAISFSVPGAEPVDITEALFSALGLSVK
jgi:uncharacterized membrane protein